VIVVLADGTEVKRCPHCDDYRPVAEFSRSSTSEDGLQERCRAYHHERYLKSQEARRKHGREYYKAHQQERLEYGRRYYIQHREERLAYARKHCREQRAQLDADQRSSE